MTQISVTRSHSVSRSISDLPLALLQVSPSFCPHSHRPVRVVLPTIERTATVSSFFHPLCFIPSCLPFTGSVRPPRRGLSPARRACAEIGGELPRVILIGLGLGLESELESGSRSGIGLRLPARVPRLHAQAGCDAVQRLLSQRLVGVRGGVGVRGRG